MQLKVDFVFIFEIWLFNKILGIKKLFYDSHWSKYDRKPKHLVYKKGITTSRQP